MDLELRYNPHTRMCYVSKNLKHGLMAKDEKKLTHTEHSGEDKKYHNFLFYFSTKCHQSILL